MAPKTAAVVAAKAPTVNSKTAQELLRALHERGTIIGNPAIRAASPRSPPTRALTYRQKLLLSGFGLHDMSVITARHSNSGFNGHLDDARKHQRKFMEDYGSKPAATLLYDMVSKIHKGDMPEKESATHSEVMRLWVDASPGIMANDAMALLYDFELGPEDVFCLSRQEGVDALQALTQARAGGELLPSAKRSADDEGDNGAASAGAKAARTH